MIADIIKKIQKILFIYYAQVQIGSYYPLLAVSLSNIKIKNGEFCFITPIGDVFVMMLFWVTEKNLKPF
jgi:hypothetical protein